MADRAFDPRQNASGVPCELVRRERHDVHAVGAEVRQLHPVTLERDPARVTVPAVQLHGESNIPPEHVNLVPVDARVRLEPVDPAAPQRQDEAPLRARAGALRSAGQGQDLAQPARSAPPRLAFETLGELGSTREAQVLRLSDELLQLGEAARDERVRPAPASMESAAGTDIAARRRHAAASGFPGDNGGHVQDRPRGAGDGEAVDTADVVWIENGAADLDAPSAQSAAGRNDEADIAGRRVGHESPERGPGPATERPLPPRYQHGRGLARVRGSHLMPDQVGPAMQLVQATAPKPDAHLLGGDPKLEQLPACDDTVLARGEGGNYAIGAPSARFTVHTTVNPAVDAYAPMPPSLPARTPRVRRPP